MSGGGSSALASSANSPTRTESSPRRVVITVPGDADPVAAVELVEVAVHRGADDGGVDEELDGPGAVAQRGEGQPALAADELQPAGDVDLVLGDMVGSQPGVCGPDSGRGGVGGVAVRVAGAACLVGLAEPLVALAVGGGEVSAKVSASGTTRPTIGGGARGRTGTRGARSPSRRSAGGPPRPAPPRPESPRLRSRVGTFAAASRHVCGRELAARQRECARVPRDRTARSRGAAAAGRDGVRSSGASSRFHTVDDGPPCVASARWSGYASVTRKETTG